MKKYIYNPGYSQLTRFIEVILKNSELKNSDVGARFYHDNRGMISYYKRDDMIAELCIKADSHCGWKNKDFVVTIDNKSYLVKNAGIKRSEVTKCGYMMRYENRCRCFVYNLSSISNEKIESLGVDMKKFNTNGLDKGGNGVTTIENVSNFNKQSIQT